MHIIMCCEIIGIVFFVVVQCIEREGDTLGELSMNSQNSCQILQACWAHRYVSMHMILNTDGPSWQPISNIIYTH